MIENTRPADTNGTVIVSATPKRIGQRPRRSWSVSSVLSLVLALSSVVTITTTTFAINTVAGQTPSQTPGGPKVVAPPANGATKTAATAVTGAGVASAESAAALVTEFEVNGLKVLVKRRAGSQTIVAGLFLRGGSRNITVENAGIEALMLDTATEASAKYPRERMRTELSRIGTSISYGINYDYSALTLGTTRVNFDRSWDIFTDVALRPAFTKDDVERVRNRLVVSLGDDKDVPDSYLQVLQSQVAYAGHPYLNNPQGTAAAVGRLTPEDLRRYHQQMMQTSRLLLVVVGDLDAQQVRQRIAQTFGKLPRGDYRPQPLPPLAFNNPSVEVTPRGLPTNYIQGVFSAPALTSPDIHPMRIASTILQGRVLTEVRYRRNLSYAPNAFLESQGANIGGIYVTAVDANQSIRVMLAEIAHLQNDPVDKQDITSTVQHYLTKYYLGQETNAAQAGELAMYELIGGGWRNSLDFIERLRAVTPEEVQRVARTYMRNIRFVVIGDPARVDKNVFLSQTLEDRTLKFD
ncbi:MAG: insulinase family protein [Acidobacteriota bacterium]|nr:insulinase family protein [Acidobacteriota bacterium]